MQSSSKYSSEYGTFIVEISGDYVGVNNASKPTNRGCHYSQIADINQFIRSMKSLGISAPAYL